MAVARYAGIIALAAGLSLVVGAAGAQTSYPSAPVRVIIPLAPGGAIDVMVRALGRAFELRTGHGFVVESRAGANTIIAANACKAAPPDGGTICLLSRSSVSINPALYRNLSYDPVKDFEPITNLAFAHQVLILNKNVPVKDFKELVDYSKRNPDKLNFGSFGVGGDTHLVQEWLKHETGAKMTHIPYKGASDAMLAFKSGDIQMIYLIVGNPDIARQINEGEVKGLLVPGSKRNPLIPGRAVVRRGRPVAGRDRVRDLVRHVRPQGHAAGDRAEAQRRARGDREDAGLRRSVSGVQGLRAGRQQRRGACEVHRRGPEEGAAAGRDLRRQAGAVESMALNYERIMAYRPADIAVEYGERECILYALGIGIGMEPVDPGDLKFVYERAGLAAFPTMAVVLGWPGRMTDPAFGIDERLVVAGDLRVVLHRPLAPQGQARQPAAGEGGDRQGAGQCRHRAQTPAISLAEDGTLRRHRRQQHLRAQARRLRRQGDGVAAPACGAADRRRSSCAICRRRPISRCSTASTATRTRCTPIPSAPRSRASIARSCTARRASASPRMPSCARVADDRPERLASHRGAVLAPGVSRRHHPHRDVARGRRRSRSSAAWSARDEIVLSNGLARSRT